MTKADKEVAPAGASAAPVVTSASPTSSVCVVDAPDHALVRAQLSDYLDGPIDAGLRQRIDAHLAGCSHCAAYLATLRSTVQVLDRLPAQKRHQRASVAPSTKPGAYATPALPLPTRRMPKTPSITLYSKADCHLCDEAEVLVQAVAREVGQSYQKVDIQGDPALFAEYRYRIPVVKINGGGSLDWPMTAGQLRRALRAAAAP